MRAEDFFVPLLGRAEAAWRAPLTGSSGLVRSKCTLRRSDEDETRLAPFAGSFVLTLAWRRLGVLAFRSSVLADPLPRRCGTHLH